MPAQGKSDVVVTATVSVCASAASAAPANIDISNSSRLSGTVFCCISRAKDEATRGITDGWGQVTVAGLGSGGAARSATRSPRDGLALLGRPLVGREETGADNA